MFFVRLCNDTSRKLTVKLLRKGKEIALRAGTHMMEETQLKNFRKTTRQDIEILNARNTPLKPHDLGWDKTHKNER